MASPKAGKRSNPVINNPVTVSPAAPVASAAPARSENRGSGTTKPAAVRQITHEQIEQRAYEIYASRGYAPGDSVADWYEAERLLRAGL